LRREVLLVTRNKWAIPSSITIASTWP
jgi:hypothetical protein